MGPGGWLALAVATAYATVLVVKLTKVCPSSTTSDSQVLEGWLYDQTDFVPLIFISAAFTALCWSMISLLHSEEPFLWEQSLAAHSSLFHSRGARRIENFARERLCLGDVDFSARISQRYFGHLHRQGARNQAISLLQSGILCRTT